MTATPTPTSKKKEKAKRPVGRPSLYTPEVHRQIVQYIRAGTFPHVAARASRIHPETFYTWLRSEDPRYFDFQQDVMEAQGQARAAAEIETRRDNPLAWLKIGPGKEDPDGSTWVDDPITIRHTGSIQQEVSLLDHLEDTELAALLQHGVSDLSDK